MQALLEVPPHFNEDTVTETLDELLARVRRNLEEARDWMGVEVTALDADVIAEDGYEPAVARLMAQSPADLARLVEEVERLRVVNDRLPWSCDELARRAEEAAILVDELKATIANGPSWMSNWLKNILDDVDQRSAERPEWQHSEYAQTEIARLRASTTTTTNTAPAQNKSLKSEK